MVAAKENRRVRMTKRMLREALLELMTEKSVGRITTTELCAVADVNRNTFYAHYAAPEDVLGEIEDEIAAEVARAIAEEPAENVLLPLLRYAYANQSLCRILLSSPDSHVRERLRVPLMELTGQEWSKHAPGSEAWARSFFTYMAAGTIALARQWLQDGCPVEPEELCDTITRMHVYGAQGYDADDA